MQNVSKSKDTGCYINRDFSKATFNVTKWCENKFVQLKIYIKT